MDLYEVPVFEVTTVLRIANKGLANNGAEPGKKFFVRIRDLQVVQQFLSYSKLYLRL